MMASEGKGLRIRQWQSFTHSCQDVSRCEYRGLALGLEHSMNADTDHLIHTGELTKSTSTQGLHDRVEEHTEAVAWPSPRA
jgi:hypothetical protein